jgi:hypothetical protein
VTDVSRALEQIEEIHERLARSEVYRGWRPVPVACSGLIGLAAAAWQAATATPVDAWQFATYWTAIGVTALVVGCAEMLWHYLARASERDRRQTRNVIGQFLPALVAGAMATVAFVRIDPALVALLPGLWALLFGVGVLAARPFLPRASGWIGLYYFVAGIALVWTAKGVEAISPWAVGGTFGVGQMLSAIVLYLSLDRTDHAAQT